MVRIIQALSLLLVISFGGCATVGQNRPGIDNFDQVSADLFRGAQPTRQGFEMLAKTYGVKTVLNLRDNDDTAEVAMVREIGMDYIRLPLDAETVTVADAEKVLTLIQNARGPVFIHCHVGRDRTGLACAAYRVRMQGWTVKDAIKDMYDHGHHWVLFPKVRESLAQLPLKPRDGGIILADASKPSAPAK